MSGRMLRAAEAGALAGTVGTLAMSILMLPANWLGILGTEPPRRIADRIADTVGPAQSIPERERRVGTAVVHLVIGAGAGAALGVARERRILPRLTPFLGSTLGAGFWAMNYIGIMPALGLLPTPVRDRPGRPVVMLLAHTLFGAVTATLIEWMRRPRKPIRP